MYEEYYVFYFQDEEGEIIDSYSHVMDSLQDTLTDEEADTTTADAEARVRKSLVNRMNRMQRYR